MLAAAAAGTALAVAGAAYPAAAGEKPSGKGSECVVQAIDERGEVRDSWVEKEGSRLGEFVCTSEGWQYSFGREESITAPRLQVDPEGKVTAPEYERPARARALTFSEMADVLRVVRGSREAGTFLRAVVAIDDGRERSPEEVEAILAGKDTTGAKIVRTFDRLDPDATVDDVVDESGTEEDVVVYLLGGIWDAIKGAISDAVNWVIDGINDIGDWFDDHCTWFPPPPPVGTIVVCQF
jgi:hypothetical protein